MASAARPTPPEGHVHLILFEQQTDLFYLEIPRFIISDNCRHPPKYLRYLGWCVLGIEGSLHDGLGHPVDLNGRLVNKGIYHYRLPAAQQDVLSHAIDIEVINLRSSVRTETFHQDPGFRQELATRDGEQCVWSGLPPGSAMHIIPFSKGDEWLQLIIENRPHGNEQGLGTLESIDDIRNGIMSTNPLHYPYFDNRAAVVLKVPNPILETNDVPQRPFRNLFGGAEYPHWSRYSLQWLVDRHPTLRTLFPNNCDAAFVNPHKPKPSDLLLHYNYGSAAVKHWGKNSEVLSGRPGLPRPKEPATAARGPTKSDRDREETVRKLTAARAEGSHGGGTSSMAGTVTDFELEQPVWDEHDVMLFFWGNSLAARERHAQKEQERNDNIDKWRSGAGVE